MLTMLLAGIVALPLQAPAQTPQGSPRGLGTAALELGRQALDRGETARALEHVATARAALPDSLEPIELALRAVAGEADERTLWSYHHAGTAADGAGKTEVAAAVRPLLADAAWIERVVRARAAAVAELTRFAEQREAQVARNADEALAARWARQLAADLAAPSPALRASLPAYQGWLAVGDAGYQRTLRALEKEMQSALATGRNDEAVRCARVLQGLAVQAGFEDLQGPRPKDLGAFARSSGAVLARARAQLAARSGEPWSVEDLEWLSTDEGDAFTRAHPDFGVPATAISPGGRYRIETDCGVETLRGVAATIELHHRRLASWFGSDPFLERQGIVRVVPEATGLESEGAPFWWAGGFQGGDTTTVRFSCSTIEGLGHGLTHELTHRFDGTLYPGIPAWLAEGRAVWTGAAYARASDETFVARHVSFGTIEAAFIKGYGAEDKLEKLVSGTLDDYRDNYTAGYALYVYLATWRPGGPELFARQLDAYMRRCGTSKAAPGELFAQFFCDGRDGRPKDLETFAGDFATFLRGFYWRERQPFTEAYVSDAGPAPEDGFVYDAPTWVWSKVRAEPYFGQGQALLAARLLAKAEEDAAAAEAYAWALAADGRSKPAEREFEAVSTRRNRRDAAWCLRTLRRFPESSGRDDPPPFAAQLPRVRELEAALLAARDAALAAGHAVSAEHLAAERERLAAHLGLARLDVPAATIRPGSAFGFPARLSSLAGFVEDGLTGYEERRVPELWYADPEGYLHVGRARPRSGSGQVDRGAAQVDAFARTQAWNLPGAWRFDARVRFTTSFASGAVVVGYQRREQGVRFSFSAGDFLFATGASDKEPSFESVAWNLSGGFDRDGALGTVPRGDHAFGGTRTSFLLSLVVDGPRVEAFIDGEPLGGYCMTDATPIQGFVGFATGMGAIVVQDARVQRLDLERASGPPRHAPTTVALHGSASVLLREADGRLLEGFDAPSQGALLVIVPPPPEGQPTPGDKWATRAVRWGQDIAGELERAPLSQPVYLCVPRNLGAAAEPVIAGIRERLGAMGAARAGVVEYDPGVLGRDPDGVASFGRTPWVLFVDAYGIVRKSGSFLDLRSVLESREWRHWLDVFRENGTPATRELPPPKRASATDPADH